MNIPVLGVYLSKFDELWSVSLGDLMEEAVRGVFHDSGTKIDAVDSIYIGNMLSSVVSDQNHLSAFVSQILGTSVPAIRVESACASGGVALHQAITGIQSGRSGLSLVIGVEKMTDLGTGDIASALMGAASAQERQAGLTFPGLYAMMARSYFDTFGEKREELAWVSAKNHFHGSLNPKAQYQFEISASDVIKSAPVADPLRVLDCSSICDGAAAVLLASPDYAKKISRHTPVIVASSISMDSLSVVSREKLYEIQSTKNAALNAWKESGLGPVDIDVVEVHDCFSIAEVMALEDLGFYNKGEGIYAAYEKQTWLGGKLPVNTSGGLKACGHPVGATGIKQIVELYLQLTGRAGKRQVKDAKTGLAHNVGGTGGTVAVHIMKKN